MKLIKRIVLAILLLWVGLLVYHFKADIPFETLKEKYAHPASKFVEIDGMQVHYRDEGISTDSIPLVLIHGTSSSLHTWNDCTDEWKKTRRVIRFDLPAFGLTGPNKTDDYSFETYVDIVNKLFVKLNINKCYIVGNSLGGGIAWNFAHAYPDKVVKMVLIDANGYKYKMSKKNIGFSIMRNLGKYAIFRPSLKYITPTFMLRKSVKAVYYDDTKITDEVYERYLDFTLREGNRNALVERFIDVKIKDSRSTIKQIKAPTLIIWGKEDALIPVTCAHKFHEDLPNSQLEIIEQTGHIAMEESPQEVIPLVADFIIN